MPDLPSSVTLTTGRGGLPVLRVESPAASAEIYLHGAHVTRWVPAGQAPVLWLSEASRFTSRTPIRGGVPLCFPWFGPNAGHPDAPSHGFARVSRWELVEAKDDGAFVTVTLSLSGAPEAMTSVWPYRTDLLYTVVIGATLTLSLQVTNRDDEAITYEEALHTYLSVRDIRETVVAGLEGTGFIDKIAGGVTMPGETGPVRVRTATDRVYPGTTARTVVTDPEAGREVTIGKQGSSTTVVWNPWQERAAEMSDFGDDEWTCMVCVETCNTGTDAISLEPGESHTMTAVLAVGPR